VFANVFAMTPTEKSKLKIEFADYLKEFVETLPEPEIPTEFRQSRLKVTVVTVRDYCVRIIREDKEPDKIQIIKDFYNLNYELKPSNDLPAGKFLEMTVADKLIYQLTKSQDNAKPVVYLFGKKIDQPIENTLAFAAFLFGAKIKNIEEFKKWKEEKLLKNTEIVEKVEVVEKIENKELDNSSIANNEKSEKEAENSTKQTENDFVITPKPTFFQQYKHQLLIAASFVLLIVCSAYVYNLQSYISENREKLATIEQITFKPLVPDSGLVENPVGANIANQNIANQSIDSQVVRENTKQIAANVEIPLSFYTNNIYNGNFLFTTDKWNFETDITGEDMNSKYGEPYRNQLKSLRKLPNTQPTIANKSIWIRFNVMNKGSKKLYVDNIKLEKLQTYAINTKTVKWSNWITPKDGEKRFELLLSHEPQIVAVVPFAEIGANSPQHFSLLIKCDKTCEKYIYKFKLVISANDGQGSRYDVSSDKIYTLGLISEL
jgi:hypothetical protein